MGTLRIYTDESVDVAVAQGLKRRGINAWSARDSGNLGLSDEQQLLYATDEGAVIFTHDDDFLRLVHEWAQQRKPHGGVIYVHQDKLSVGGCIRRLVDYALILDAEGMNNQVEFL